MDGFAEKSMFLELYQVYNKVERTQSKAKRLMCSPNPKGMLNGNWKNSSYDDKSVAQRKLACRNSIEAGKNRYKANQMGNCSSIGKQAPKGLTPNSRYMLMVSICTFCWSSPYRSFKRSISGFRAVILDWE